MLHSYQARQYFKLLIQCLKNQKENCIFWIGAGISKIAGYPSWKELVLEMLLFFEKNKNTLPIEKKIDFESRLNALTKERSFSDLFQELKQKSSSEVLEIFKILGFEEFPDVLQWLKYIDSSLYIREIQQLFKDKEKQQNNEIYFKIGKFLSKGISVITTNIDRGLETALSIAESEISIVSLGKYNLDSKIFYLHGRIDKPKSWILSERDYGEKYANSLRFMKFWRKFMNKFRIIIFLGYGLKEKDIRRKFYNKDSLLFWIERIPEQNEEDKEEEINRIVTNFKINGIIVYPITYKYENENSTFGLLEDIYQNAFGPATQFTGGE